MATLKQMGYISHTLKTNKVHYPKLEQMFPTKIKDGSDVTYWELENKIAKQDIAPISDIIGMLKDDHIMEGFNQLEYLLNN